MAFCSFLNCKVTLRGAYCGTNNKRSQRYTGNSAIVYFNLLIVLFRHAVV